MEDKKYEYLDKIQTIETERLFLKKANDEDFKILSEFLMDSEVTKYFFINQWNLLRLHKRFLNF